MTQPIIKWLRCRLSACNERWHEVRAILLKCVRRRPQRLTLSQLDAIPYVTESGVPIDPLAWERLEQLDAHRYVRSEHRVLELGGCYGIVSCVINHNLSDPAMHVVAEPAQQVISALRHNRTTHLAHFSIFNGAVSRRPVVVRGEGLARWTEPSACGDVPYMSIEQLQARFGMDFNCLVADCEGALEQFVRDFPTFFDDLNTILFERDREWEGTEMQCDYGFIEEFLRRKGFVQIKDGAHPVWSK